MYALFKAVVFSFQAILITLLMIVFVWVAVQLSIGFILKALNQDDSNEQ